MAPGQERSRGRGQRPDFSLLLASSSCEAAPRGANGRLLLQLESADSHEVVRKATRRTRQNTITVSPGHGWAKTPPFHMAALTVSRVYDLSRRPIALGAGS